MNCGNDVSSNEIVCDDCQTWEIENKKFIDTRNGDIVTQVPILEMEYFEEIVDN